MLTCSVFYVASLASLADNKVHSQNCFSIYEAQELMYLHSVVFLTWPIVTYMTEAIDNHAGFLYFFALHLWRVSRPPHLY